jgi:phosphatidylserine/phosphatidylglycerophosphate/cardiolipin synthase-like enzyme
MTPSPSPRKQQPICLTRLLDLIAHAEESVLIAGYSFNLDIIITELVKRCAANPNFTFRVLLDGPQNAKKEDKSFGGGQGRVMINQWQTADRQLYHHKFVVIDGSHVVTGSANFTYIAFRGRANNLVFAIDEPNLAEQYTKAFMFGWQENLRWRGLPTENDPGPLAAFKKLLNTRSPAVVPAPISCFTNDHLDPKKGKACEDMIVEMINQAKKAIFILVPNFSPTHRIARALLEKDSAVRIEIHTNGTLESGLTAITLALKNMCKDVENGTPQNLARRRKFLNVSLYDKSKDFIHHKFIAVDAMHSVLGSSNFGYGSFNFNSDNLVFYLHNSKLASELIYNSQHLPQDPDIQEINLSLKRPPSVPFTRIIPPLPPLPTR